MNDDWAELDDVLRNLSRESPDAQHSALVRERCLKAMRRPPLRRTVEAVIVGGFCAAYITIGALLAVSPRP